MKRTYKSLLLSILICMLATGFSLWKYYPGAGVVSSVFILAVTACFIFLAVGILLVVLRLSGFTTQQKFIYVFTGVGNIWLGLAAFFVWLTENVRFGLVETFMPCLILGSVMLVDTFIFKPKIQGRPISIGDQKTE